MEYTFFPISNNHHHRPTGFPKKNHHHQLYHYNSMATIASLLTISSPNFTLFSFGCHLPPYQSSCLLLLFLELHSQTTRLFDRVWPSRDTYHLVRRLCQNHCNRGSFSYHSMGLSPSLVLCSNRLASWRSLPVLRLYIWAILFHTPTDYNSVWLFIF
jgi:hypothetical protein